MGASSAPRFIFSPLRHWLGLATVPPMSIPAPRYDISVLALVSKFQARCREAAPER